MFLTVCSFENNENVKVLYEIKDKYEIYKKKIVITETRTIKDNIFNSIFINLKNKIFKI